MYDTASTPPLPAVSCDQLREQLSTALACLPLEREPSLQPVAASQPPGVGVGVVPSS